MIKRIGIIVFALALGACSSTKKCADKEGVNWIEGMANYSMNEYMPPQKFKFDWSQATLMKGLVIYMESDLSSDSDAMVDYFKACLDHTKGIESGIHPNVVSMGHMLAYIARTTNDETYKKRALAIYEDYKNIVRAPNGGVSHRHDIVELWDDTIYMVGLFLMEMYTLTGDQAYLDEFVLQLKAHHEILADQEWGLWVHGWYQDEPSGSWHGDFSPEVVPEQKSSEFWGRGNGWMMCALADALEIVPENSLNYDPIKKIYLQLLSRLPELQDEETGHWYQLPVRKGEKGNWIDSSCTSMFGYAIQKGLRLGILNEKVYQPVADKAYNGLVEHSVKLLDNGYATSTNVCIGTVIGNKEYYYNRERMDGKECALGTFIMFGVEHCR